MAEVPVNGPRLMCLACEKEILGSDHPCECEFSCSLRELVELKRMKDGGTTPAEYERRKLLAWREAFRVCGVVGDPKP